MNYLTNYTAQRGVLTRLCRVLGIPLSEQGTGRKVPRHNNALRVSIFDYCLGPAWGDCTGGKNAAEFDQELIRMVDTLNMGHGFHLAAAQACIRAGKHQMKLGRADMAVTRDHRGKTIVRPMTHEHRMERFKAAEEFYAEARRYQRKHEEARRAPIER